MRKMPNAHEVLRTVLSNRQAALELAVRQLAQAVGGHAPNQEEITAFFHDFMDGYWDAFEEATSHDTDDLKEIDREILELQAQISQALDQEHQELLNQYEGLANNRMTTELDHAFLVGYQTAIRLLLMGILPLSAFTVEDSADTRRCKDNET